MILDANAARSVHHPAPPRSTTATATLSTARSAGAARRGDDKLHPLNESRALRLGALAACLGGLVAWFFLVTRPWYQNWGSTSQEQLSVLPGDEIVPWAAGQETRAITIYAPAERVWPWLAQLGQDRGGFYSYDLIENLVGCDMPTEDRLRPEKQTWQVGDKLWMYPPGKAGGMGFATLRAFVPGYALGFGTRMYGTSLVEPENGSWAFLLERQGERRTRLLARGRGARGRSLLGLAFDRSIFEPLHFVMERRMMLGIKDLAEGRDRGRLRNHLQVALWTLAFGLVLAAPVLVLRRSRWWRPLAGFAAAAVAFQYLSLGQPPVPIGILCVLAVAAILWGQEVKRAWWRRAHAG